MSYHCFSFGLKFDRSFQTLFLIFLSIVILIGGVVLLTLKKPEPAPGNAQANVSAPPARDRSRNKKTGENDEDENNEEIALRPRQSIEGGTVWELGNASDSDDDDRQDPKKEVERTPRTTESRGGYSREHQGLVEEGEDSDSDFGDFTTNKRT